MSTTQKTAALANLVHALKRVGIDVAEDITSPAAQKVIDGALGVLFPAINAVVEAFSDGLPLGGLVADGERLVLPWAEGKLEGLVDTLIQRLHAELQPGTAVVTELTATQALKAATSVPSIQAVHADSAQAAELDTTAEKRAFVEAHQP